MEFGKVDHPQNIDFTLPQDPPGNASVFIPSPQLRTHWFVGLTGWGDAGWQGDIYPLSTKTKDFLLNYSSSFNCIELNPSFYHPLVSATIQKWVSTVPTSFRFCPKLWQGISHGGAPFSQEVIGEIQRVHQGFGQNLGPAFLQLPPKIGVEHLKWLLAILDSWSTEQELFLEVRNSNLVRNQELLNYLSHRGIGLVITDVAGYRELVHMRLLVPRLFLRFVATGYEKIDRLRIRDWLLRLRQWNDAGLEEASIFLHHTDNLLAPSLARTWLDVRDEVDCSFFSMKTPLNYRINIQRGLFD